MRGKQKAPARPFGRAGTKWGVGVRQALFPMLALGAKLAASFPTPFSTASGVSGLVAGPSSFLAAAGLLSEAFQLAWAGGCATGS